MKRNFKIPKVSKSKFYSYLKKTSGPISDYEIEQMWIYRILGGLHPLKFPDHALLAWKQAGGK